MTDQPSVISIGSFFSIYGIPASLFFSLCAFTVISWLLLFLHKRRNSLTSVHTKDIAYIWSKPLSSHILHADIPRFSTKITISTANCMTIQPPDESVLATKQLILMLSHQIYGHTLSTSYLHDDIVAAVNSQWKSITADTDFPKFMQSFLISNERLLGRPLFGLLKTASQAIVSPGIVDMKRQLHRAIPFKDARGSWFIHFNFEHDSYVLVSHRKSEEAVCDHQSKFFSFQWNLDMVFNRQVSELLTATFYVASLQFDPLCSPDYQEFVRLQLDDFMIQTETY